MPKSGRKYVIDNNNEHTIFILIYFKLELHLVLLSKLMRIQLINEHYKYYDYHVWLTMNTQHVSKLST